MNNVSRRTFLTTGAAAGTLLAGLGLSSRTDSQNVPAPAGSQAVPKFVSIVSSRPTAEEAKKLRAFQAGFLPRMIKAPGILAIVVFARPAAGDERLASVWESDKALTTYQASDLGKEEAAFESTLSTPVTREQYPLIYYMPVQQPSQAFSQTTQSAPRFFSIVSSRPSTAEAPKMRSFQAGFLPRMIKAPGVLAILVYARPAAGDERLAAVWESEKALDAYRASDLGKEEVAFESTLSVMVTREAYPLINYL